jgi:hypothetical protein
MGFAFGIFGASVPTVVLRSPKFRRHLGKLDEGVQQLLPGPHCLSGIGRECCRPSLEDVGNDGPEQCASNGNTSRDERLHSLIQQQRALATEDDARDA